MFSVWALFLMCLLNGGKCLEKTSYKNYNWYFRHINIPEITCYLLKIIRFVHWFSLEIIFMK